MIKYQYLEDLAAEKISKYKNTDRVQKAGAVTNFFYLGHAICIVNHSTKEFILLDISESKSNKNLMLRLEAYNEFFGTKGYKKVRYFTDMF